MNIKLIAIIGSIVIILALGAGIVIKFMQKAEGYRANEQTFNTFEPHFTD